MPRRTPQTPRLAVVKFASCDGCQLSILDCEDELLQLARVVDIANFPEASSAIARGPYDLTLVEGSITTPHDAERIHRIRRQSRLLATIGACATTGGVQALRNFADVKAWIPLVYPHPEYIDTLSHSTPIANHVHVDFELPGCPVDKRQLLTAVQALLGGRRPILPADSVCTSCKQRGVACVIVARGEPCLGPVTRSGCGAICPAYGRGCYGCFGPVRGAHTKPLEERMRGLGLDRPAVLRFFRGVNAGADAFRKASERHEP